MENIKELTIHGQKVPVLSYLGKGKSGYSYLVEWEGNKCVAKQIHHEPCAYYQFGNKIEAERHAYERLKTVVSVPHLISIDEEHEVLLKEYADGKTGAQIVAEGGLTRGMIQCLFDIARVVSREGLNLDYFPNNFVWNGNGWLYVDYEFNQYSEEWNLANWGIWYWANSAGMKHYLETGSHERINQDATSGKPVKDSFLEKVEGWIRDFGY